MLYQIDLFNGDITPPFADPAAILSALDPPDGTAPLMGSFIVRVDDSLPVQNPANLQDLLLKTGASPLASYAGSFSQMVYDDLLDPTDVDTTVSGPGTFGSRSAYRSTL